jgi:hypothetical protein
MKISILVSPESVTINIWSNIAPTFSGALKHIFYFLTPITAVWLLWGEALDQGSILRLQKQLRTGMKKRLKI